MLHASPVLSLLLLAQPRCTAGPPPFPVRAERPLPLPENAAVLQRIAREAGQGKLGDGRGVIKICTRAGALVVNTNFDSLHVFGSAVALSDLLDLLHARAAATRNGKGPMAGRRSELLLITLALVNTVSPPEGVDPLIAILSDPDPDVRNGAGAALVSIGEAHPGIRTRIAAAYRESPSSFRSPRSSLPRWLHEGT